MVQGDTYSPPNPQMFGGHLFFLMAVSLEQELG